MIDEFTISISTLEFHFVSSGHMDVCNYETERRILIISSWMNPLNIKELLNSNTDSIFLDELNTIDLEQKMDAPKRRAYVNSIASDQFIINTEDERGGTGMRTFLNHIDIYREFTVDYFGDSQDIMVLYDKFDALSYWD